MPRERGKPDMAWSFNYGVRIDFEVLVPEAREMEPIDSVRMDAVIAAADIDALVAAALRSPDGQAYEYAYSALMDRWADVPVDYARDIAPHVLDLTVEVVEVYRDERSPSSNCVYFRCYAICDSEAHAREFAQNAADEWEDGDTSDYDVKLVEGGFF
jgi:hypothetical protein